MGRSVFFTELSGSGSVHQLVPDALPSPRADVERCWQALTPRDVDLGWVGMFGASYAAHRRIQELRPGDRLRIVDHNLVDRSGRRVGRMAQSLAWSEQPGEARVVDIVVRSREQTAPQWQGRFAVDEWEVVLAEAVVARA